MIEKSKQAKRKYSPPEVAAMWGISPEKIIGWILAGELRAIDASSKQSKRPRYLIDVDDIEAFERRREVVQCTSKRQPFQRRKQADTDVIAFF